MWAAREKNVGWGNKMYSYIEYINRSMFITDYILLYVYSVIDFPVSHRSYTFNFPSVFFSSTLTVTICCYNFSFLSLFSSFRQPYRVFS